MFSLFSKKTEATEAAVPPVSTPPVSIPPASVQLTKNQPVPSSASSFAEIALNNIHDGVILTNAGGIIQFINPAAVIMTDVKSPENAVGLDYTLIMKLENGEGQPLSEAENPLIRAFSYGQPLEKYVATLVSGSSGKRIPIALTMLPLEDGTRIITFRNIEKELAEESEQAEFISTASHEMRTPVATIDGYLSLCLNPATATVDERAHGYLESAKKASEHLGKLFQDLLDVTKLDDGRIQPKFQPVEIISLVQQITADHAVQAQSKKLNFGFGSNPDSAHRLEQVIYASVDLDFLREILDNLIDNAVKYTPKGGSVTVNAVGDGDYVKISVADSGIGISSADLEHVFQKFYRADNSDTREVGGTGLGLYLVKQRAEAMGGRVWAESAVGQGSVFYVALPRISAEEYQKRLIAVSNAGMINNNEGGTNE